jgi:hypothetical protein
MHYAVHGNTTAEVIVDRADQYRIVQDALFVSDFDRMIIQLEQKDDE